MGESISVCLRVNYCLWTMRYFTINRWQNLESTCSDAANTPGTREEIGSVKLAIYRQSGCPVITYRFEQPCNVYAGFITSFHLWCSPIITSQKCENPRSAYLKTSLPFYPMVQNVIYPNQMALKTWSKTQKITETQGIFFYPLVI